jgi:tetratricopeptide (TPR) repeat protein
MNTTMTTKKQLTPKQYLAGLRKQFPDIRPYDEDDLDWAWCDDGYQFLEGCDFGMAELTFQRVIAARPDDPDGFEGLAMVYKAIGHKREAMILIDEAVVLAKKRFAQEYIDEEALLEIAMAQRMIHEMEVDQD